MCGLIGMFTVEKLGFSIADRNEFKNMMVINSLRGAHSTGVAGVDMEGDLEPAFIKGVGNPYDVFQYNKSNEFFTNVITSYDLVMGHGRFATQGGITSENAHPFTEGHITLVHNGTISNFATLKQGTKFADEDVDSRLICKMFAEQGAKEVLPRIHGAYVFIWYDAIEKTLNIARNHARPLFIGLKRQDNTIFWSSEKTTLEWNDARNKTPMKEIYEMPTHEIHTYNAGDLVPDVHKFNTIYPATNYKGWQGNRFKEEEDDYGGWYGQGGAIVLPFSDNLRKKLPNPKSKESKVSNKDALKLSNIRSNVDIIIGEEIVFMIDDIDDGKHGNFAKGTSAAFPTIEFSANISELPLENAYAHEFIKGKIGFIMPSVEADNFFDFKVIIHNPKLLMDDLEDSPLVEMEVEKEIRYNLINSSGIVESVAQHRYLEMVKSPCPWCNKPLTEADKAFPEMNILCVESGLICCYSCGGELNAFYKSIDITDKETVQ